MHNIHLCLTYKGYRQYNFIKIINLMTLKIIIRLLLKIHELLFLINCFNYLNLKDKLKLNFNY